MSKYRIKLHREGYYTIQQRYWFFFWKEMWFYSGECGLDSVYSRHIYEQPPVQQLERLEKYGH